jgi:hypothetical protein
LANFDLINANSELFSDLDMVLASISLTIIQSHFGSTPGDASAAFEKCQTFFENYFLNIIFENYF